MLIGFLLLSCNTKPGNSVEKSDVSDSLPQEFNLNDSYTELQGKDTLITSPQKEQQEKPGPEVTVIAFLPAQTAPCKQIEEAISSSIWIKHPPTLGKREAILSTISVDGVIGYPAANVHPAAIAPSVAEWFPFIKWLPVNNRFGSAFTILLLKFFGLSHWKNS